MSTYFKDSAALFTCTLQYQPLARSLKRLICVSLPTKANKTALKRQFPSAEVIVAAISCHKGISSGTRDIVNLSFGNPTWPRSGKVRKNFFLSAYVSSTAHATSKTSSSVPVVRAANIRNKFSRSSSMLVLNLNHSVT